MTHGARERTAGQCKSPRIHVCGKPSNSTLAQVARRRRRGLAVTVAIAVAAGGYICSGSLGSLATPRRGLATATRAGARASACTCSGSVREQLTTAVHDSDTAGVTAQRQSRTTPDRVTRRQLTHLKRHPRQHQRRRARHRTL
jgi:hypothetical protein